MWILLRAEAQCLANTFKTKAGRQALLGFIILAGCLLLAALAVFGKTLMADEVVESMRADPAFPMRGAILVTLTGPMMIALGFVFATAKKDLFASSRADLLLLSPIPRIVIAGRVFLRLMFTAFALQTVMTLPVLFGLVFKADQSSFVFLLYPLCGLSLLSVFVALTLLMQTCVARYLSGPILRLCAEAFGVSLIIGITAGFLYGITIDTEQAATLLRAANDIANVTTPLGWPIDALHDAARGAVGGAAIGCFALLASPWPVLWGVGRMYGRCRENHLVAHRPISHRLRAPRGRWPTTAWASIARKDLIELTRNRGGIFALVELTCIQLMMLRSFTSPVSEHSPLSPSLQHGFGLITAWQLLMMLLGPLLALSIAGAEGPNLSLLATAPITPSTLLRGKSVALLLPMGWSVLVTLVAAPLLAGIGAQALLIFAVGVLPLVAVYYAVVASVGAMPALFHRKDNQPLAESLAAVGPVLVVSAVLGLAMMSTHWLHSAVRASFDGRGWLGGMQPTTRWVTILGTEWACAGMLLWIGISIAKRNLGAVLAPRAD